MAEETSQSSFMQIFLPWIVCFSASLFLFYEFIQGNMFASIADSIMRDFNIQVDKMTYLSSIYYFSNVVFLFVAGYVLDKYSAKKTILIAMLLCVLSTFVLAHTHSFTVALFCRFITGIGSAFCFLGPVRLVSRWFPPLQMAMITGVIVTLAMTGGMLAQYPLTKLVADVGWRDALTQIGWFGSIMLACMCFGVIEKKEPLVKRTEKSQSFIEKAKYAYLNVQTIAAAFYTSLMNMAIAVFGAMMGTLYLEQRLGVGKESASIINSMLFLGAIIGGPLIGAISDKLALRILPMKIAAVISLFIILSILYLPLSIPAMKVLFFLLGLFTSAQVISYALVAESTSITTMAMCVSVVSILTQGGYVIYQNLFSYFLMQHGEMQLVNGIPIYSLNDYQYAAMIIPIGLIAALVAVYNLKETHGKRVQELE